MIRKATKKDIIHIEKLGEKLHVNFSQKFNIENELNNKYAGIFVYELNDIVVGYIYIIDALDYIDLISIYVDENYRNKHIGQELLNYIKKIYLNKPIILEVSENNNIARKFYEKNEFTTINIRKNYYKDSNAIIMKWGV